MTAEERAKTARSLARTAVIMAVAGVAAMVFGVLGKSTSIASEPALARVNFSVMILGGALATVIGVGIYLILRLSSRP